MIASPVAESGPWSLGTLIGLPLAVISTILLIALGVWIYKTTYDVELKGLGALFVLGGVTTAILTASPLGMWPYDSEFHQWRDVTGTIERVESRQVVHGEGMSERFVFVIDGQPFGVDDTRAAVAEKGDTVDLRCKREWEYAANSGWGCRWAGVEQ